MRGTCPECGLGFEWADVFDPSRVHLSWYVEHARAVGAMLRRSGATIRMLLIPNRFWHRLGVERVVYPRRIWGWVAMLACLGYLLMLSASVLVIAFQSAKWNQLLAQLKAKDPTLAAQWGSWHTDMGDPWYWLDVIFMAVRAIPGGFRGLSFNGVQFALITMALALFWAVILSVLPTTRRIAKLRFAHISRALALSCAVAFCMLTLSVLADSLANIISIRNMNLTQYSLGLTGAIRSRWSPLQDVINTAMSAVFIVGFIWIQWFWIAAYIIGWRIRSIILLLLALIASLLAGYTAFMYISLY